LTDATEQVNLIKLQRRIRMWLAKQRSIRSYNEMCTEQMSDEDKMLVGDIITRLGPFYFLSEQKE